MNLSHVDWCNMSTRKNVASPLHSKARRHIARSDRRLAEKMKLLEPMPSFPIPGSSNSHFHSLARTILFQQLAGKAASTIHERVKRLGSHGRFPTPSKMLSIDPDELRRCGVSAAKQAALNDLAARIESGRLTLRGLKTKEDDEIIQRLTKVRGIGIWSAQMFLIFRLGRTDILPSGDLGVQEGLRILDGLMNRPTPSELEERAKVWKPYRSFATWTLYRIVDEQRRISKNGD